MVQPWHDRKIVPGKIWDKELDVHLRSAREWHSGLQREVAISCNSFAFRFLCRQFLESAWLDRNSSCCNLALRAAPRAAITGRAQL
jgi:hypothetical protein